MSVRIDNTYKIIIDKNGKTKLIRDDKAVEAKLDLCTRLKRRNSKRIRVVKQGQKSD